MAIHYQKDGTVSIMNKALQEFDKPCGSHFPIYSHEPEFPLRADSGYQIKSKSGSCAADYRCLAFNRPRGSCVMIRSHPRLVSKKDHRLLSSGQFTNTGIFFQQPLLNFFRPLLVGTPYRTLRGQSQLNQQPANRGFAQLYTKSPMNDLPDHLRSPEGKRELELQWVLLRYRLINPLNRLGIQLRLAPSPFASIKTRPATIPIASEPSIHGCPAYAHCFEHDLRALPILHAANSSLSKLRQGLMLKSSGIRCFHGCRHITKTISCLYNFETVNM